MRKPRIAGLLLAICAALFLAASALGADRTDRSFGTSGVAEVALPPEAQGLLPGIFDLANAPGGQMAAAIGNVGYTSYFSTARFNQDGSLDTSFGNGGFTKAIDPGGVRNNVTAEAQAIAVQANGMLVVVGYKEETRGRTPEFAPLLARYRSNGTLDSSFGHDGKVSPKLRAEGRDPLHPNEGGGILHDVAVEGGGRIVAVGAREELGGGPPAAMAIAYRPDGRIDTSFGHRGRLLFPSVRDSGYTALRSIKVTRSGKLLIFGYLDSRLFLARLTQDGMLDHSFGGGDGRVSIGPGIPYGCGGCQLPGSLAVDRRGRIVVLAEHNVFSPVLARFLPDGTPDRSFGKRGLSIVRTKPAFPEGFDLALQRDGRMVVVGEQLGTTPDGHERAIFAARRYLPNGRLDRGFGSGGTQTVDIGKNSAALSALTQPDGRVVAGGLYYVDKTPGGAQQGTLLMTRYLAGP